VLYFQSTTIII